MSKINSSQIYLLGGHQIFSLKNILDRNVMINILDFLSRNELNLLASLIFHSGSIEIEQEVYNQPMLDIKFGKCLLIYSWIDLFWKEVTREKIALINTFINTSRIEWNDKEGNFRSRFCKSIWNRVSNSWENFQNKRRKRMKFIQSISKYIKNFKDRRIAQLVQKRKDQKCFFEESSIKTPLQKELRLDCIDNETSSKSNDRLKWIISGYPGIGKTSLLFKVIDDTFPEEYLPTIYDYFLKDRQLKYLKDGEEHVSTFTTCFIDSGYGKEYARLRPLSYQKATVFTLCYAINNWTSFEYLVEKVMWECTYAEESATFVVMSTKNDLREEYYWKSLLDTSPPSSNSIEEPISKEDGIELSKAIGAVSFIETSAKTGRGTCDLDTRLAIIRHTHLDEYSNGMTFGKKCQVQ